MLHTRLVCYAICMETVQTSYLMHVSLHTGSKSKLLSQYSLQMHEGAQTLTTMWITVLDWRGDSAQTSYLMRINGHAWRRLLVSCRKKTQQVSAETNCGYYCSLVSHHQGRTPGSTSGSSNSWRQTVIDAQSYPIRFYTDFCWVLLCCHIAINCYKRCCDTVVLLLCNFVSLCATDDIADVT